MDNVTRWRRGPSLSKKQIRMTEKAPSSARSPRRTFLLRDWRIAILLLSLGGVATAVSWNFGRFHSRTSGNHQNPLSQGVSKTSTAAAIPAPKSVEVPNHQSSSARGETPPVAINPEGYIGIDACAACHAERVAEFRETRHFQACLPTPVDTMPPGFLTGRGTFIPSNSPVHFLMSREGNQFLQTAIQKTPQGERRTSTPIELVYGSGAETDEVYFTWKGDLLSELPMCWLHPIDDWGVAGFDRNGSGDFTRPTTPRCMECHNTWMNHVPGTLNEYKRHQSIYGITCEVCHGPGTDHVRHHEAHPDETAASKIVHPGHLSRERRMDLCAQCHSNALKHRGPAFRYRPGLPLDDFYKTLQTKHPEDDHVANQVSYLRESECFQQSDQMTCITCHDPHVHKPRPQRGVGGADCRQCHQPDACHDKENLPLAVRDNCVGCHMPKSEKIQVSFATRDTAYYAPVPRWEHRIAVYPAARDEILLEWYRTQSDPASQAEVERLRASLFDHWVSLSEQYATEYRLLAAIHACRQALRFKGDPTVESRLSQLIVSYTKTDQGRPKVRHLMTSGNYDEAFKLAQEILTLKPHDAITVGNLGTLYALLGQKEQARQQWEAAAKLDADDPYGPSMLGWQSFLDGDYESAVEQFLIAESIEPYLDKINYQLGLTMLKLERWPDAVSRFRRVLIINPRHIEGHIGLNTALRQTKEYAEATSVARQAANLTREQNLSVLEALAETYAEAGQPANAERTARKMLDLAQKQEPQKVPEIRRKLDEWAAAGRQPKP